MQTDTRAHHITVVEQWVSDGGALQALEGSGRQASKQTRKQQCDSKGGPRVERKRLYGVLACRSSARGPETVVAKFGRRKVESKIVAEKNRRA